MPSLVFTASLRIAATNGTDRNLSLDELVDEFDRLRWITRRYLSGHPDFSADEWPALDVEVSYLATGSALIDLTAIGGPEVTLTSLQVALATITAAVAAIAAAVDKSVDSRRKWATNAERTEAERKRQLADAEIADADLAEARVRNLEALKALRALETDGDDNRVAGGAGTTETEILNTEIEINWDALRPTATNESQRPNPAELRPGANLRGRDLSGASLMLANLNGADLRRADLSGADLLGAQLSNADLRGAILYRASLWDANLSDADLSDADLNHANLRNANLMRADLRGASLVYANLSGASLVGASLVGASLREAELGGADLRNADLHDAKLLHAALDRVVGWGSHSSHAQHEGPA